jgi:hypothetical protein
MDVLNRAVQRRQAINREPVGGGLPAIVQQLQFASQQGAPLRARGFTYSANVTALPTQLLALDFDRKFLFIQNNDLLGTVWLVFGAPAQIGLGIRLAAGGGALYMDYACLTAAVNAIGTIALNPNITIITG